MTDTSPQIINLNNVKVVGYCHHCQQPLLDCNPVWVATDDDFLCPYYNARKLAFCSKECLDKQLAFVLEQLRLARTQKLNPTL
jgi:hypothetical protein